MKFKKEINGKEVVIDVVNENTFNIYEREGFKKVEETEEVKVSDKDKNKGK
jgi:hypothetical protein